LGYWMRDYMRYRYTATQLAIIADNYGEYAKMAKPPYPQATPKQIAHDVLSSKIDFDRALNALGKGKWDGLAWYEGTQETNLNSYKDCGVKQLVVIADILGYSDSDLEVRGVYDVILMREIAYKDMASYLNRRQNEV